LNNINHKRIKSTTTTGHSGDYRGSVFTDTVVTSTVKRSFS